MNQNLKFYKPDSDICVEIYSSFSKARGRKGRGFKLFLIIQALFIIPGRRTVAVTRV